jgi:hypothetical protein
MKAPSRTLFFARLFGIRVFYTTPRVKQASKTSLHLSPQPFTGRG